MNDIDSVTGLPKDLVSFEDIVKEEQTVVVKIIKKKFGKKYTTIQGLNQHEVNLKDLAKKLKSKFACGGTAKEGVVELQGDHISSIKKELIEFGFSADNIEIKK